MAQIVGKRHAAPIGRHRMTRLRAVAALPRGAAAGAKIDLAALTLTGLTAAVHLILAPRYDLFGDELYFIVCGQHPAFGYADQPPLVPQLSAALYALDPQTWVVRLPAVFAASALVWLTVALARLLGGRDIAAWTAGLAAAGAPMLAGLTAVFTTATFEPLGWTAIAYLAARAVYRGDERALLWAGLVTGLCLEAKYGIFLWLAGLGLGLLLTPQRRMLTRPRVWIGLAIAAGLAAPSLLWQQVHGWPFLQLVAAQRGKNVALGPLDDLSRLAFGMNIVLIPVWLAGVIGPFVLQHLARARFLAIAFAAVLLAGFLLHGKDYYVAGAFPAAFALGSCVFERVIARAWTRAAYIAAIAVSAAISLPLVLPILPPARLLAYEARLGIAPPPQFRFESRADLPLTFGFQFGWHDLVAQVAQAYQAVPAGQRAGTAILVDDYAEAAAIDLYGPAYGLPAALSGHNQYFFWGLRGQTPQNILYVHGSEVWNDGATQPPGAACGSNKAVGTTHAAHALVFEQGKHLTLCTDMQPRLGTLWPALRFMY
jgi:4-amino-4-deoxy-L-arabinose transferase-like glycosyltransferase